MAAKGKSVNRLLNHPMGRVIGQLVITKARFLVVSSIRLAKYLNDFRPCKDPFVALMVPLPLVGPLAAVVARDRARKTIGALNPLKSD